MAELIGHCLLACLPARFQRRRNSAGVVKKKYSRSGQRLRGGHVFRSCRQLQRLARHLLQPRCYRPLKAGRHTSDTDHFGDLCVTRCPCPPGPRTRCEASFSGCAGPVAGSRCCAGQYATNSMRTARCFRQPGSWSHQSSPRVRDAVGLLSRRTFAPSQGSFLHRSRFISKAPCRVFL